MWEEINSSMEKLDPMHLDIPDYPDRLQDCPDYIKSEPHPPHKDEYSQHKDEYVHREDYLHPEEYSSQRDDYAPRDEYPQPRDDFTPHRGDDFTHRDSFVKDDFVSLVNDSIGYCYDTSGLGGGLPPLGEGEPLDTYTYTINYTHSYRSDVEYSGVGGMEVVTRATPPPPYTSSFSSPSPCSSSSSSSLSPQELSSASTPVKYNRYR